eukprot:scaffold298040_cov30-Tisochrysis_lutea.AAC.1
MGSEAEHAEPCQCLIRQFFRPPLSRFGVDEPARNRVGRVWGEQEYTWPPKSCAPRRVHHVCNRVFAMIERLLIVDRRVRHHEVECGHRQPFRLHWLFGRGGHRAQLAQLSGELILVAKRNLDSNCIVEESRRQLPLLRKVLLLPFSRPRKVPLGCAVRLEQLGELPDHCGGGAEARPEAWEAP